jgi:rhomboid protease GluP
MFEDYTRKAGAAFPATATLAFVLLNLAVFAWQLWATGLPLIFGTASPAILAAHGGLAPILVLQQHEYWRIVTSAFLHGSLWHVFTNMFSLLFIGAFVEIAAGSRGMVAVYCVSFVAASLAIVAFGTAQTVTVGASGGVFGLIGAVMAIGLKSGESGLQLVLDNVKPLATAMLLTFLVPGISRGGHVGGLLAGFLIMLAIFQPRPEL